MKTRASEVPRRSSFRLRSQSLNTLRLRRIFDLFDKNGDGTITAGELSQALSHLGLDSDATELRSTLAGFIPAGSGGLSFEDLVTFHRSMDDVLSGGSPAEDGGAVSQEEADLTEAFKVFDADGDGYISAAELQVVLAKLGLPEAREIESVRQMICSVDQNCDGRVDFFEFKDMMRRSVLVPTS